MHSIQDHKKYMTQDDYQDVYSSSMEPEDREYCSSPGYASYYYRPPQHSANYLSSHNDSSYPPAQNDTARRPKPAPRASKVKRYLLTRDPKDRRISGNGLGMKVVGGKEIPGTKGRLGAYIARIQEGGVADALGQLKEGDLVLEWNGVSLVDRTYEEVQGIVVQSGDDAEVEIVIRSDINMITGKRMSKNVPKGSRKADARNMAGSSDPRYSASSPPHQRYQDDQQDDDDDDDDSINDPLDINGNQSSENNYPEELDCELRYSSPHLGSSSRIRYTSPEFPRLDQATANDTRSLNGDEGSKMVSSAWRGSPLNRQVLHERPASADCINRRTSGPQPIGASQQNSLRTLVSKGSSLVDLEMRRESNISGFGSKGGAEASRNIKPWRSHERIGYAGSSPVPPTRPSSRTGKIKHTWPSDRRSSNPEVNQQHPLGEVQLQVCYDSRACILYVTVIRARSLYTVQDCGFTNPDPFVKVYLLPGRSLENQRRTRSFTLSSCPEWNQTMVYPNISPVDLPKRHLEVSAWNYRADVDKPNEFLGEVVLNLSDPSVLDEHPRWHQLHEVMRGELAD